MQEVLESRGPGKRLVLFSTREGCPSQGGSTSPQRVNKALKITCSQQDPPAICSHFLLFTLEHLKPALEPQPDPKNSPSLPKEQAPGARHRRHGQPSSAARPRPTQSPHFQAHRREGSSLAPEEGLRVPEGCVEPGAVPGQRRFLATKPRSQTQDPWDRRHFCHILQSTFP